MPIEESANMLIMAAAVAQRLPAADAASFATTHYAILHQWAEYLVANALDPENQNQTDDFTGWIAHSANLALKGIIGIGAMSVIAKAASNPSDAAHYETIARGYISRWVTLAQDSSGTHLKLAYDQDGTWSLKYNGYADRLLGVDLVPTGVAAQEAAWYLSNPPQQQAITLASPLPGVTSEEPADYPAAWAWFTAEYPVLLATIQLAADTGHHTRAWQLPHTLVPFFERQGHWHDFAADSK